MAGWKRALAILMSGQMRLSTRTTEGKPCPSRELEPAHSEANGLQIGGLSFSSTEVQTIKSQYSSQGEKTERPPARFL